MWKPLGTEHEEPIFPSLSFPFFIVILRSDLTCVKGYKTEGFL